MHQFDTYFKYSLFSPAHFYSKCIKAKDSEYLMARCIKELILDVYNGVLLCVFVTGFYEGQADVLISGGIWGDYTMKSSSPIMSM